MALFSALSRFSIRKQILIGFMPVLLVLGFLAFTSYGNFKTFSVEFSALSEITQENILFLEIERDTVELQRNILVYSYVGYQGVLKKIEFLQSALEKNFETVRPIAEQDEEIKDRFDRMFNHYEDHKEGFSEAVKKRKALKALSQSKLEPLIEKNHETLDELLRNLEGTQDFEAAYLVSRIERNLLQTDINIRAFETTPDSLLIKETNLLLSEMKKKSLDLKEVIGEENNLIKVNEFLSLLDQYQDIFSEIITINRVYLHLVNVVLAGKAAEIDKLSRELDSLVSKRSKALSNNISENIQNSQSNYITLSMIAGFIGVLSALLIAMGIAKPVNAMASTLSALARGKSETEIPGQERRDEVGEMAKAANEFKTMAGRLKEQGQEIRESQAQLSAIVDNIVDGLITIDEDGAIQSYNNACEKIFGFSRQEAMGQNVKILMPEPYHSQHDGYLSNYHNTGEKKIIGIGREVEGKKKDGSIFSMELSVSQVDIDNRKLYSGIVRDVTERKAAEEALVQANTELEEFAYRTSHDLRSPLVSSISLLGMTKEAIQSDEKGDALESLGHVQKSLEKLETLVKDILALTHTKNAQEEVQVINFQELVGEALDKFSHMDNFARLDIQQDLGFQEKLKAKRGRLMLVLENLISNAIKYQDPGKERSFIKVSTYEDKGRFVLEVRDNGLGVPENQQDKLFTMFKRFHPKVSFGSGLGLYMMKKSADIMSGTIEFEDPGQGSAFKLTIPIKGAGS